MKLILKCRQCGMYTMKQICSCGGQAITIKPAKYSPDEKYGHLRRQVKREDLIKKNLL